MSIPRQAFLALLSLAAAYLLSGCAPMECRAAFDFTGGRQIELCEHRECRDAVSGKFVGCP